MSKEEELWWVTFALPLSLDIYVLHWLTIDKIAIALKHINWSLSDAVCQGMWDLRLHGIDRYFRFVAVMQYNPWFLCDGSNIAPF